MYLPHPLVQTPAALHHELLPVDLEAARHEPAGRHRIPLQTVLGARPQLEPGLAEGGRREQGQSDDERRGANNHGPSSDQNSMVLLTATALGLTSTSSPPRHSQRPAASPSTATPVHIPFRRLNDVCLHSSSGYPSYSPGVSDG